MGLECGIFEAGEIEKMGGLLVRGFILIQVMLL